MQVMRSTSAGDSFTPLPTTMMDLADETEKDIEAVEKDEEEAEKDEQEEEGEGEEEEEEKEDHLSRKKGDGEGEVESAGIFNLLKEDGLLAFNLVERSSLFTHIGILGILGFWHLFYASA